jgi:pantoate--beta-alanine ligase
MLAERARGQRIGFVPTMGFLHDGHTTLMKVAREACDLVAVSIFVNPKQFGPKEDLSRYPRDKEGDLRKCRDAGVSIVFMPEPEAFYPPLFETMVSVAKTSQGFCGAARPGHFDGVTTVVLKLFNLAQPHEAFFGEKDFQQLAVIRAMVRDLSLPITVTGVPTVREPDGLALSSRNVYLSSEERHDALVLRRALEAMKTGVESGERSAKAITELARAEIAGVERARVDYVEVADALTLAQRETIDGPTQALLAVFIGRTRLIDNLRIL